jgi:CRP/FNR family transcriptional regulator
MGIEQLLRTSYLCSELDEGELNKLVRIIRVRKLKKKELLFFEGEPAAGFYILLKGRVRVYKASPDGKEYTLHLIDPGQMFAEAAIFTGKGYPANCSALEDSTAAFIPKDRFLELIKGSPRISLKMIASLAAFVREFNRKVEELSLKEISARLASYLLEEQKKHSGNNFELEISKGALASRLGTVSETLSRNLKKLRDLECIEVAGKTITILDPARLQAIAGGEKI